MDLALFDFDGTITTRETLPDFMRMAVPARRLFWGRLLLAPWVIGYRLGLVPGTVVRRVVVKVGFSGIPLADVQAHGRYFAATVLPLAVRPDAMARIAWHQQRGDKVVVVSGGFDVYLEHWCREQGVELVCSALEDTAGKLTGRYRGAQCVLEEKVRRVRESHALSGYDRIHAYGDTHEDLPLLALAHEAWYQWRPWRGQT